MAEFARPSADSVVTSWTSTGANKFGEIDEVSPSDADYVTSPLNPAVGDSLRLKLSTVPDPGVGTGHTFRIRMQKDQAGGPTLVASIKIFQGGGNVRGAGTLIDTIDSTDTGLSALANVPNGWVTYTFTLGTAAANSITNYADLYAEVIVDQT